MDPGGLEVLSGDYAEFAARIGKENHALKRALTDPRLSPVALTGAVDDAELRRSLDATIHALRWPRPTDEPG